LYFCMAASVAKKYASFPIYMLTVQNSVDMMCLQYRKPTGGMMDILDIQLGDFLDELDANEALVEHVDRKAQEMMRVGGECDPTSMDNFAEAINAMYEALSGNQPESSFEGTLFNLVKSGASVNDYLEKISYDYCYGKAKEIAKEDLENDVDDDYDHDFVM